MFSNSFEGMAAVLYVSEPHISSTALKHNRQKSEPDFSTQPRWIMAFEVQWVVQGSNTRSQGVPNVPNLVRKYGKWPGLLQMRTVRRGQKRFKHKLPK